MKDKMPAWLVLTVICVVAAALLAGTNLLTKDVIAENTLREKYATLMTLMPDAADFEEKESGVVIGKDADGNPVGYSLAAAAQGFGGEVETTVAATSEGTIRGISVGGANFAETAGLGARAKEPEFQEQFAGKTAPVALTKDGGEIEALSGATITSRAVISGVNQAMEGIAAEADFTVEVTIDAEHLGENKYAASAPGFCGPVKVYLTLNDRTIEEIDIGDNQFNETTGLGALAKEDTFQGQFIGKTLPVTIGDIDAISGATITTNAVLEAIGKINTGLDNGLADMPITEETEPEPTAAPAASTSTGTSSGVRRRSSSGSSASATAEPAAKPNESMESAATGTTTVRRRTSSSSSASATAEPAATESTGTSSGTTSSVRRRTSSGSSTSTVANTAEEAKITVNQDGSTYDAAAQGFGGPVRVYLTLDENKTIMAVSIGDDAFAETEGLGAKAKEAEFQDQFIGKTIPLTMDDIDAISSATITTTAVLNAINAIAEEIK